MTELCFDHGNGLCSSFLATIRLYEAAKPYLRATHLSVVRINEVALIPAIVVFNSTLVPAQWSSGWVWAQFLAGSYQRPEKMVCVFSLLSTQNLEMELGGEFTQWFLGVALLLPTIPSGDDGSNVLINCASFGMWQSLWLRTINSRCRTPTRHGECQCALLAAGDSLGVMLGSIPFRWSSQLLSFGFSASWHKNTHTCMHTTLVFQKSFAQASYQPATHAMHFTLWSSNWDKGSKTSTVTLTQLFKYFARENRQKPTATESISLGLVFSGSSSKEFNSSS